MTDPTRLAAWPKLLAQLDTDQYEALTLTLNALSAGHLTAAELDEFATEANMAGLAYDLAVMQGPVAVAEKRRADTRAQLVAEIAELATSAMAVASDLATAANRLYDFDEAA